MKKYFYTFVLLFIFGSVALAQSPGDTIMVNTFNYSQTYGNGIRDTMIHFPNLTGITFEKIYMLYNMRCKNGLISNQTQRSQGCGEWDYSCNTYITDSSRTDSVKATFPTHVIKGFTGNSYAYTFQPTYTYYQYTQKNVVHNAIINEFDTTIGLGNQNLAAPFQASKGMAKSQFLWTAAELSAAGIMAGNISSIKLNISNVGSAVNFLRIKIKPTSKATLSATTPDLTGFTEVYFNNTILLNGLNEFNFYNNFNWNGTDNIIIEFSFENNNLGTNNIVLADTLHNNLGIVSEGNDYALEFTGNNFAQLGNSNFANITNQLTISFWCYGNPQALPGAGTSIIYATDSLNNRQINVHLPWSNSNVYWDCGSAGTYDRINQVANPSDFKGKWNNWTFIKNTTSGSMKIYLNGGLWFSGTGKTIPIKINNFEIGNQHGLLNPYFGKVDEFSIWNTELSASTIQNWMNKNITSSHPNFNNLIAHYSFNEGVGNISADSSQALATAALNGNPIWRKEKANDIFKGFFETNLRPTVTFVQGTYNQTITNAIIIDSIINNPNTVYSYKIANHAVVPFDTTISYTAGYVYKYDGETGAVIDSILIPTTNIINIGILNYYKLSPSRFQIMSFVTPYGIGLDLGSNGKTWTFDVTDLAPILKNTKRMTIDAGGQWQEDLNIKFMFIVGTPPHDIKDISNIWKVDNSNYTGILNDNYFEPRSVLFNANASSFKIRTAITGHGQDGEFVPRTHYLNINGGAKEFEWSVWKPCASNPIYPQGGTWVYDRAGWCPGAPTNLTENEITSFVTPGAASTIDYGIDTVSGQSNYWVSSQLVSYGAPNFSLDAAIVDIKAPTQKVEYSRTNTICTDPTIIIKNTGSTALTSVVVEYWVNNNVTKDSYTWHGNLKFLETAEVVLPTSGNLWSGITGLTNNTFNVSIKNPNGGNDAYSFNNKAISKFDVPPVMPSEITIFFKTNSAASENSYKLLDAAGTVVFSRNNMTNNTNYNDDVVLTSGCYSFVIDDTGEDGFDFWANSAGTGQCRFKDIDGNTIKVFNGDFGKSLIYNFTIDYPLTYQQINKLKDETVSIFPNPAQNNFVIEWNNNFIKSIEIYNSIGMKVPMPLVYNSKSANANCSGFAKGIYIVEIKNEKGNVKYQKVVVE
ncbi:MAG: hypothetical protein RJA07_599 [Bacteroidota bacterium]|jgi:hypothetical protein